jgi:hypothetical protein
MAARTPLSATAAAMVYYSLLPELQGDVKPAAAAPPQSFTHGTYELRRSAHLGTLTISRRFICCCLDLPLKDLGRALGVSFTTVKKLRTWSGLPCWPRRSILVGKFAFLSFAQIQTLRRQYIACLDKDAPLRHVLQRVERLVCGLPLEPPPADRPRAAEPAPGPLSVLDELTDADWEGLPIFTEEELDALCPRCPDRAPAPDPDAGIPWGGAFAF